MGRARRREVQSCALSSAIAEGNKKWDSYPCRCASAYLCCIVFAHYETCLPPNRQISYRYSTFPVTKTGQLAEEILWTRIPSNAAVLASLEARRLRNEHSIPEMRHLLSILGHAVRPCISTNGLSRGVTWID